MNNLQSVKTFLSTRRSTPPVLLGAPFPSREEIMAIDEIGLRVPDHKKLEPWRLIALEADALKSLSKIVGKHVHDYQEDAAKAQKMIDLYEGAGCVIAMVFCPKDGTPKWEQQLSMGAVGISLVNAAIAHGYGANWLSGFLPDCPQVLEFLGINSDEKLCGLVHIGTAASAPPERPRPNLAEKIMFLRV